MTRALSIVMAIGLAACSSAANGLPSAVASLAQSGEVTRFEGWSIAGLTLYRHCMAVPDRSTCSIVGVGADGALVRGVEIWRRLPPDLTAMELAQRAHDLVLGEEGQQPLRPGSDRAQWAQFVTDEEWSVVEEPTIAGGAVVFFTIEGEMSPTAQQLRVDRATGAVARQTAANIWLTRAPRATVSCEPRAACGCDVGCVRVDMLRLPRQGEVFRELDGPSAGTRYFRAPTGFLRIPDEACTEACPPVAPTYRCELRGESCERIAL